MRRTLTTAGLTSRVRQRSRLRRRRRNIRVEFALVSGEMRGWRAEASGTQTIRLIFDKPQKLSRISLIFEESEMVSRWRAPVFEKLCASDGISAHLTTIREVQEYRIELSDVGILELVIVPDINRGAACASLKSLRLS